MISCSLGCTQSHKIYCAPKPISQDSLKAGTNQDTANDHVNNDPQPKIDTTNGFSGRKQQDQLPHLETLGTSSELQDLFCQYPQLRFQLRDIYQTTLEEEWVEVQPVGGGGGGFRGGRPSGRGRGGGYRNRGPWTREKGFNRGLGKVRKLRERCEAGVEIGKGAEGFMRFVALVHGEGRSRSQEPA